MACRLVAYACAVRHIGGEKDMSFCTVDDRDEEKEQNEKNRLDYQVIEAVMETSLTNHVPTLNAFLARYGIVGSNYSQIFQNHCFHSGTYLQVKVTINPISANE